MAGGYEPFGGASSPGGSYFSFERGVSGESTAGREPAYPMSSGPDQSFRTQRGGGAADGNAGLTAARRKKIECTRNSAAQPFCNILSFANRCPLEPRRGL